LIFAKIFLFAFFKKLHPQPLYYQRNKQKQGETRHKNKKQIKATTTHKKGVKINIFKYVF